MPKKPIGLQSKTGAVSIEEIHADAPEDLKKLSKDTHNVLGVSVTKTKKDKIKIVK